MNCRPIKAHRHEDQQTRSSVHANTPPLLQSSKKADVYICNTPPLYPDQLAKAQPASVLTTLTPLFRALPAAHGTTLPPPADKRVQVLYDVFRQLQGLNASVKLRIPIKNLNKDGRRVHVAAEGRIGEYGAIDAIEVDFSPAFRRKIPYMSDVPIIGLGFHVFIPRIWLNEKTRRLHAHTQAGVLYMLWPFAKIGGADLVTGDQHDRLLDMAKLTSETRQGPGYNLDKSLPHYPWQLAEIALKMISQQDFQETIKAAGIDTMQVEWDKAEILVEGRFSPRQIRVGNNVDIDFAPIAKEKHRFRISGTFLKPELTIEGIRSIQLDDGQSALHMATSKKDPDPLRVRFRFYPDSWIQPDIILDRFHHERVTFETTPPDATKRVKLNFREGIEIQGLRLRLRNSGPELDVEKIVAKQASFEGLGVDIQTEPGGKTTLENFTFRLPQGKPRVEADIRGQSIGSIRYGTEEGSHGQIKFRIETEATGHIVAGPDPKKKNRSLVQVSGQIEAEIPEINFLVQSKELAAFMQLSLKGATASGQGRLRVWPDTKEAILEALGKRRILTFEGTGGQVRFSQSPAKVASWPELKSHLGASAKNVTTDLRILLSDIRFSVQRMQVMTTVNPKTAKPTLKITDADIRDIQIRGDTYGRLYIRTPTGHYFPVVIAKDAAMKNARIAVKRIQDRTSNGIRTIHISSVELEGKESKPTFSKRDQRICGIDRQHVHATVGIFDFNAQKRDFSVNDVDPHFHLYLHNPLLGGCIKID